MAATPEQDQKADQLVLSMLTVLDNAERLMPEMRAQIAASDWAGLEAACQTLILVAGILPLSAAALVQVGR